MLNKIPDRHSVLFKRNKKDVVAISTDGKTKQETSIWPHSYY